MKEWSGTVIRIDPMIKDGKNRRKRGFQQTKAADRYDGVQQQKRVTVDSAALRSGEGNSHRSKKNPQSREVVSDVAGESEVIVWTLINSLLE
jgi:hypothetical protein